MGNYVDYNEAHPPGFEDEPSIRRMEGTFVEDFTGDDKSYDNGLLEYDQSDEESDGQDALENLQHLITYWKPRGGDISILPHMYAQQITRLTGTYLFAEEAEKRYRLYHGNFELALAKLVKLEPLLVCLEVIYISCMGIANSFIGNHQEATQPAFSASQRKSAHMATPSPGRTD